jgi:hypothetical protein
MWARFKNRLLNWVTAIAISGSVVVVFYCFEQWGIVFALSKWATVFWLGTVSARVGADLAKPSDGKNTRNL